MPRITKEEQVEQMIKDFKKRYHIRKGETLYTTVGHVSRSGMMRTISVFLIRKNSPINITYWSAKILERSMNKNHDGMNVYGCGMDMGFEVVYTLSYKLFKHDKKVKNDAGYVLKQRWM